MNSKQLVEADLLQLIFNLKDKINYFLIQIYFNPNYLKTFFLPTV